MPRFTTFNPILPTPVEAHRFDGSWFNGRYLSDWANAPGSVVWHDDFTLHVATPAGEKVAKKFDWVTRNDKLEFGVVERDRFDAKYTVED